MVNELTSKRLVAVHVLFLILMSVLVFSIHGAINPKGCDSANQIEFQTISKGYYSGFKSPAYFVIANEDEWADIWNKHDSICQPRNTPLEVNFSETTIIAVFMGEFKTGGYGIEIKEITDVGRSVIVKVEKTYPDKESIVTLALSQPYHIVKTDRIDQEITFDTVERTTESPYTLTSTGVDAWAVLLEMNEFPEGWSDLPVDFINCERMQAALSSLGWQSDHMRVVHDNLTISVVQEAVEWLTNNTDDDDVIMFYIFTHGTWMRNVLLWNDWFPAEWKNLNTSRKVLMIDTCAAEEFIELARNDPLPHVSLACCASDEVSWAGIEEEGLPIIGSVWNHYFTNALCNSSADLDGNGFVSIEEAYGFSSPHVQRYMNETVFAVREFLQSYHEIGIYPEHYDAYPHPVMDDQYLKQLHLDLQYYKSTGDLDDNGIVDIYDVVIISTAFGSESGDPKWNQAADLNYDDIVDIFDVVLVATNFGKTY